MRGSRFGLCGIGLLVAVLGAATACGGDDDDSAPSRGGSAGTGGGDAGTGGKAGSGGGSGGAGSGGTSGGGTGGAAGDGSGGQAGDGTGGEPPVSVPENPRTAYGLVAGGGYAKSETFQLFYTLGDQPSVNAILQSESHQLIGGIVGATH